MQYFFTINQAFLIKNGLNMNEGAVYSYLLNLPSWAEKVILGENVYYFASKTHIAKEMPLVSEKPDTIYRICKNLKEKGFIDVKKIDGKDYIKIDPTFAKKWFSSDHSEKFPNELGYKSEKTRKNFRTNSDINPTYHNTIDHNTNNQYTIDHSNSICEKKISQTPFEEIEILDCCFEEEKQEGQKQTSIKATKKNITGPPGKKKEADPLFKDFVEIHNQLCIDQTGSPAKWEGKAALNGKCINELISYFRKSVRAKEPLLTHDQETDKARQGFEYVRANWGLLKKNDRYLASIDLAMINKNIENIFMFFRDYASGKLKVKGQYDDFYDELRKSLEL